MFYFRTYGKLPADAILIRRKVFQEEQGFSEEFDGHDRSAVHIVLCDGEDRPMGTCRYFPEGEGGYAVGRLAVLKECRGRRCGEALLREAERQIRAAGGREIRLSAQVRARGFYEKAGYLAEGEPFPDEGVPHIRMRKALSDSPEAGNRTAQRARRAGLEIEPAPGEFAVCKLPDFSQVDPEKPDCFLGRTESEHSLVCPEQEVPANALACSRGWRAFRIRGTLDFSLVGILADLTALLAGAGIGIFALSTYDTDWILTRTEDFSRALEALRAAGYRVC